MTVSAKGKKPKGSRNERRIRDWLERRGYSVTKAGGSLGVWDLIGHLRGTKHFSHEVEWLVFVQVKSLRAPDPSEVAQMKSYVREHYGTNIGYYVARWGTRTFQRTNDITLKWYAVHPEDGLQQTIGPTGEGLL